MKVKEKEMVKEEEKIIEDISVDNDKTVEGWKKTYGRVYSTLIADNVYTWRTVKRAEYNEILKSKEGDTPEDRIYNREKQIIRAVVLNITREELEKDFEELPGLAVSLSEEVLEKSGFAVSATIQL